MEIKNGIPPVKAPVTVSVRDAKSGCVYRHRSQAHDAVPYLYLRTLGGSMMSLASGSFDRRADLYSHDWIEVEAHVTYTGDKK